MPTSLPTWEETTQPETSQTSLPSWEDTTERPVSNSDKLKALSIASTVPANITGRLENIIEQAAPASEMGREQLDSLLSKIQTGVEAPQQLTKILERAISEASSLGPFARARGRNIRAGGTFLPESTDQPDVRETGLLEPLVTLPRAESEDPRFKAFLTGVTGQVPTPETALNVAAVYNVGKGIPEFFTSPLGPALGLAGAAGGIPARATALGFMEQMAGEVPKSASEAGRLSVEGTPQEAKEALLGVGQNILLPAILGGEGLTAPIKPKIGGTPDAAKERVEQQGSEQQYPGTSTLGVSTETGGGNRPVGETSIQAEAKTDVAPSPVTPGPLDQSQPTPSTLPTGTVSPAVSTPSPEAPVLPPPPAEMARALAKQQAALASGEKGPYPEIEQDIKAWQEGQAKFAEGAKQAKPDMDLWKGNEVLKNKYKAEQAGPPSSTQAANAPKGIAASVRNKWTSATEGPLGGSEAGFINIDPIKDLVDKATPHVKAAWEAVREIGKEAQNIGKTTDYLRAVMNWSGKLQKSFSEAASAQKEIQTKVKDPIRREGITNWIQADGDMNVLQQRKSATESWVDPTTGNPHPQRDRLVAGYDAALNLTPEEIAVANDVKNAYSQLGARGLAYDVLKTFKQNYVTQAWNLKQGPQGTGITRTLRDNFKYSRASTFPTFFDGEQAGYVPKTKDISQLLPSYLHEMNSVIAARQLVEQMSNGVASDGRPLLVPRGSGSKVDGPQGQATLIKPKTVKGDTSDYKVLPNQPALNDWTWASTDEAGNPIFLKSDLAIHPEAYSRLKAALGRSAIREWYNSKTSAMASIPKAIVKGIDFANRETKRTMLGLFAPFHQVQEATHAVGHRVNPVFNIPKIDLVNDAGQADAANHGLMLLPDRASEQNFMEGFKPSGLLSRIPGLGRAVDWYSNYLFHQYIPGLKYKTYQAILSRNTELYSGTPGVSLEDIKSLSSEQTNAAFGHLNYAALGKDPTITHLAQLGLLAPDFLEARARFTGQAIKGLTGAKVGREQLIALATLAMGQAVLAYTGAQLTGGKWDPKRPFEFTKDNKRYSLRSVPEDTFNLITDTRRFVYNRLSPIIGRTALQLGSGVDWLGRKVTAGQTLKEMAQQPIPLTLRGLLGTGRTDLSAWEQMANAVGIRIGRYNPASDVAKLAQNWKSSLSPEMAANVQRQQQENFGDSAYKDLRSALEKNDKKEIRKAFSDLTKTVTDSGKVRTPSTILKSLQSPHPFTGSSKLEPAFRASLSPDQQQTYDDALIRRKLLVQRLIKALQ